MTLSSFFYYIRHYLRFKSWFWFILFLAFETGAVIKYFYRHSMWQTILNAVLGLIWLGIFLRLTNRKQTVESSTMIKNGWLVFVFTFLGALSGVSILPYLIETLGSQKLEQQLNVPLVGVEFLTVLQVTIMTFVTSAIGLGLANKVSLDVPLLRGWLYEGKRPKFSTKWITISILGGFFGTVVITLLETYVFQPYLPQLPALPNISLWKNFLSVFYGGIVEEVLLRLFLMTVIVWVFSRFQKFKNKIPASIYWISILFSSILFGLGHLPATASLFGGLNTLLVIRAIISNGLLGILFGYLYWKKGLEYAILSHLSADLFLHVILPLLLS